MAGGLSDTVAVWLLFNPRKRRFGVQGAIPKNQGRLGRSIGRTVSERLLTPEDVQSEMSRPELRQAFERAVEAYLPAAMQRLGAYLSEPGVRGKIRELLQGLFGRYVAAMSFPERLVTRVVMNERRFERLLNTIESDGVDQIVLLLDDPAIREEIARAITPVVWEKLHSQLPDLVQRLDVGAMVERKVAALPVERVEDVMRSVMQSELNMIVTSGYVLGGLIGVGTFFLSRLIGL